MATAFNIQVEMTFDDFGSDKPADFDAFLLSGCEPMITEGIIEWPPVATSTATATTVTLKFATENAYYQSIPTVDAICKAFGKNLPTRFRTDL